MTSQSLTLPVWLSVSALLHGVLFISPPFLSNTHPARPPSLRVEMNHSTQQINTSHNVRRSIQAKERSSRSRSPKGKEYEHFSQPHPGHLPVPVPAYPALSRRRGEQGEVVLRWIGPDTRQSARVQLIRSSGFLRLDRAALRALRQLQLTPATGASAAASDGIEVRYRFTLMDYEARVTTP